MRYLLFLFVFISSTTLAQNGINYQGAATDSDGAKLVDQNISLRTSVLKGGVDGTNSYSETHNTTTDQFGLFNVVIGQGEVVSGAFDSISWGADAHFLKVELDATGGSDYSLVSTTQMMSVPYALHAENVTLSVDLDSLLNSVEELKSDMNIITEFFGCTEPTACNFDENAVIDDGTCEGLIGCTDPLSSNYNSNSTCDDGTCQPYVGMYNYGGVIYHIEQGIAYIVNINEQVYTNRNLSNCQNIVDNISTGGYNDWMIPGSGDLDLLCAQKSFIDLIASNNGGTVFFEDNNPYISNSTYCNGGNNGAGPYCILYYTEDCYLGGYSGNCCCQYSEGFLRSIRAETY